jgi:uncharacterized protein YnzC (UPF0291/DUF896 family)
MKADSQPNDEVRARVLHRLSAELHDIHDIKKDDGELADQIRALKMVEQEAEFLKQHANLSAGLEDWKQAFKNRLYQAVVIDHDGDFLKQLTRIVKCFKKKKATGLNPGEAAIKEECVHIAFEMILEPSRQEFGYSTIHDQIKKRLQEKGIRVDASNWPRIWRSLGLNDPAFAGRRGRPKKQSQITG